MTYYSIDTHKRKHKRNKPLYISIHTHRQTTTTQATSVLYRCIDTYIHHHTNATRNKPCIHPYSANHQHAHTGTRTRHNHAPQRQYINIYIYSTKASTRHPHANNRQQAQANRTQTTLTPTTEHSTNAQTVTPSAKHIVNACKTRHNRTTAHEVKNYTAEHIKTINEYTIYQQATAHAQPTRHEQTEPTAQERHKPTQRKRNSIYIPIYIQ